MSLLRAVAADVRVSVVADPVAPNLYTVLLNSYADGPATYQARGRSAQDVLSRVVAFFVADHDAPKPWPFVA